MLPEADVSESRYLCLPEMYSIPESLLSEKKLSLASNVAEQ
ncbi:hypothetical protein AB99_4027 [Escherichia coli 1-182-04_S3_C1]|nr:hypothetical protein AB99_4027 [Escherichia coli 1-182-04_S3_C1]